VLGGAACSAAAGSGSHPPYDLVSDGMISAARAHPDRNTWARERWRGLVQQSPLAPPNDCIATRQLWQRVYAQVVDVLSEAQRLDYTSVYSPRPPRALKLAASYVCRASCGVAAACQRTRARVRGARTRRPDGDALSAPAPSFSSLCGAPPQGATRFRLLLGWCGPIFSLCTLRECCCLLYVYFGMQV
jgi:hypothetical protein